MLLQPINHRGARMSSDKLEKHHRSTSLTCSFIMTCYHSWARFCTPWRCANFGPGACCMYVSSSGCIMERDQLYENPGLTAMDSGQHSKSVSARDMMQTYQSPMGKLVSISSYIRLSVTIQLIFIKHLMNYQIEM